MAKDEPLKKIYGLIGYPVKHSYSPAMHNAAFNALKINAEYKLFELKPEELEGFLRSLEQNKICGLNVTVPYKEKVLDFVEIAPQSFFVKEIKAVNTIVVYKGRLEGSNTDIQGFKKALEENINPTDKRVAVLGAGGAARAVAYVLARSLVKDIHIYDIDKTKSRNIINMIKKIIPSCQISSVDSIEELEVKNKDLLINATPIGLSEKDPCLIKEEMLHKDLFVYDLIYNPAETKLLALAKKNGLRFSNGLKMLLYQGIFSFSYWTGVREPPVEVMRKALMEAMQK